MVVKCLAGLVWLLSKDSKWMPEKYKNTLIQGIKERDQWARELYDHHIRNSFLVYLFSKTRRQFRLTKTVKAALRQLVDKTKAELGISDNSEKILKHLLDIDIIKGFYDYHDWLKSKKK